MAIPLLAFAAAGSALKGIAGIAGGVSQRRAYAAQALGAEVERKNALLRRVQLQAGAREQLATTLGNITVIQSARGVSNDDPTSRAIERRTIQDAYRDEAIAALGELNRAESARMAAKGYKSASRWAVPLSLISAGGDFASALSYGQQAFAARGPSADLRGLY